jgi:hypothetical protein
MSHLTWWTILLLWGFLITRLRRWVGISFEGHSGIVSFTMNDSSNGWSWWLFFIMHEITCFLSHFGSHPCSINNEIHNTGCWYVLRLVLLTCCNWGHLPELVGWQLSGLSKWPRELW